MTPLIPQIKHRLSLRAAARLCSIELPDRDGVKFRSPLRPDHNPSCSISRERFHDWSTGDSLDAIGFFAAARGLENRDAIRTLATHLGLDTDLKPRPRPALESRPGTLDEIAQLAALRHLSVEGLTLASKCGVLTFGKYHQEPAWFVGDAGQGPMQARRLNGQPWAFGERPKALTIRGQRIHHLIGFPLIGTYPHILLCEGGPDLLAAFCAIQQHDLVDWCPLGLLGTSASIPREQAETLSDRHVRIAAHPDLAGQSAAEKWAGQLGGRVDVLQDLPGDLNDLFPLNLTTDLFL